MKCEHGNEIKLIRKQVSPPYSDDGEYCLIAGCDHCKEPETVDYDTLEDFERWELDEHLDGRSEK